MTLSRSDASRMLEGAGLRAKRALGQNFVVDPNTVRRIAHLARVGPGDRVIEIGAGLGSLTLALAETGARVTAVEIDPGLVPLLRVNLGATPGVDIVHADATELEWTALLGDEPGWVLVANLPYNVATPLVADIVTRVPAVSRMLVMVQREVAERFAARPSTPEWGAVSVRIGLYAEARIVGHVPATVFLPRPNVESSLVEIVRHDRHAAAGVDEDLMFTLVRAGFAKRRKMLRGALAGTPGAAALAAAGIDGTSRAEELSVEDWIRLTRAAGSQT